MKTHLRSLVIFIQAIDGKLYEDPLLYGDGFFIRAEGFEDPEIIIKYSPTTTLDSARKMAYRKIKEFNLMVKLDEVGEEDIYAFPPQWSGLVKGARFTMKFKDKIAVPHQYKSKIDYPTASCKFIAWELEFPMQEVLDFLDKRIFYPILSRFLLGKEIIPPLLVSQTKLLKNRLERQLKNAPPGMTIKLKSMLK